MSLSCLLKGGGCGALHVGQHRARCQRGAGERHHTGTRAGLSRQRRGCKLTSPGMHPDRSSTVLYTSYPVIDTQDVLQPSMNMKHQIYAITSPGIHPDIAAALCICRPAVPLACPTTVNEQVCTGIADLRGLLCVFYAGVVTGCSSQCGVSAGPCHHGQGLPALFWMFALAVARCTSEEASFLRECFACPPSSHAVSSSTLCSLVLLHVCRLCHLYTDSMMLTMICLYIYKLLIVCCAVVACLLAIRWRRSRCIRADEVSAALQPQVLRVHVVYDLLEHVLHDMP